MSFCVYAANGCESVQPFALCLWAARRVRVGRHGVRVGRHGVRSVGKEMAAQEVLEAERTARAQDSCVQQRMCPTHSVAAHTQSGHECYGRLPLVAGERCVPAQGLLPTPGGAVAHPVRAAENVRVAEKSAGWGKCAGSRSCAGIWHVEGRLDVCGLSGSNARIWQNLGPSSGRELWQMEGGGKYPTCQEGGVFASTCHESAAV